MLQRPDFDEICDVFIRLESQAQPAEMHGLAVGQICAGRELNLQQWLVLLEDFMGVKVPAEHEGAALLQNLLAVSQQQLEDAELTFEPLLADDDHEIDVRLEALSQWCQGFITGFALVARDESQWSEVVAEAMEDMSILSQVGLDDDDEEAEAAYVEVYEYLRLLTLNLYLEMHPVNDGAGEPLQKLSDDAKNENTVADVSSLFGKSRLH